MARRPNYAHERNERNRAKQAKREAKLKQRQEASAGRKAGPDEEPGETPTAPEEEPR